MRLESPANISNCVSHTPLRAAVAAVSAAVFAAVALLTGRIVFGVDIARIQLWLTRCPRSV